jgi:hypothetical protein
MFVGVDGYVRLTSGWVEAAGLATAGNLRPGSCVPGPSQDGRARQTSWLDRGKRSQNTRGLHAGGGRRRTYTEATARESGCGSPGRESSGGALQGRERGTAVRWGVTPVGSCSPRGVGGHGERRGSKRPRASREPAETVERGKNPEDGTDEGLATLVPHGRPRGRPCRRRGTRRSCVRGQESSREADPRVPRGVTPEGRRFEGRIPRGVSRRYEPAGGSKAHEALKRA